VYIDKEEVSLAQLGLKLAALKADNEEFKIFINGDEDARLGLAIEVLDTARSLGITKIAFETRTKPSEQ
jgi:biopolymer transport protein ExbD